MAECYDCGMEYGGDNWIEAIIPDHIWYEISPTGDEGGILCISCIAKRVKEKDFMDVPVWLRGTERLMAMPGDPGDFLLMLRDWYKKNA